MSKAKMAKFQGKEYKQLDDEWEVKENSTSMTFAGEETEAPAEGKAATVAGYIIDVQIAYNKEENGYPCFAEFFKIAKKAVDFKAYTAARKDAEEGAEEDENVDEIIPKYTQKQWDEVSLGKKFEMLEQYMDLNSEFDIEMEDFDEFSEKMKEFGIEIPANLKDDLKG